MTRKMEKAALVLKHLMISKKLVHIEIKRNKQK